MLKLRLFEFFGYFRNSLSKQDSRLAVALLSYFSHFLTIHARGLLFEYYNKFLVNSTILFIAKKIDYELGADWKSLRRFADPSKQQLRRSQSLLVERG